MQAGKLTLDRDGGGAGRGAGGVSDGHPVGAAVARLGTVQGQGAHSWGRGGGCGVRGRRSGDLSSPEVR